MESRIDWELRPKRAWSYYDAALGEFAPAKPPNAIIIKKTTPIRIA